MIISLIDRADKQARVYSVMSDWTRNRLIDIIKKNVYTDIINDIDDFRTRIYSDSYASYQVNDFDALGFKLNKVNHSVWFDLGLFIRILSDAYPI